jgi:NAD(P)-dependent dehydrogenase (short-subunit alcohol dehydrogenase family)
MGRVEGKVAVVTGAASGIGQATALALAAEGARVGIADVDEAGGEAVAARIREAGGEAFYQRTDVTSLADLEAVVGQAADEHGRLDVLVNNAAVAVAGSAGEMAEQDWARVVDVNLSGVWRACAPPSPAWPPRAAAASSTSARSRPTSGSWAGPGTRPPRAGSTP